MAEKGESAGPAVRRDPLPDAPARARIREAIDRNLLVEAAAGTGKTTSLVDRMVALVLAGTPVQRICAVTFTIKAAAQLDQRFQNALESAAREEAGPERRDRLAAALAHLDACFIGTIHAFCSRLLRERPVEAGLDPGFEELDEAADLAARAESWKRYGERLFTEGSPVLGRLLASGMGLEQLRETYDLLCEHGDSVPVLEPAAAPPDLSPARAPVEAFLDRALAAIPPAVPAAGWDRLQSAIRTAGRLRQLTDLSSGPELVAVLKELERGKESKTKSWPSKQAGERMLADLNELRASVIDPALRRWREYLHPIALAAIQPAVDEYREWRRREARVNFQDQLVFARDLLRDHPAVRRAFQERFTPVLVDEFQDTDPVQAEVLLYLTGRDTEERDWRKLAPLPGSLFVVGDPKQSIYRFRRADIQTYDTVSTILQNSGGEVLRLSTNFRSTDAVCSWVNGVFERIFPGHATASQAAHVALHPHRGPEPSGDCAAVYRIEVRSSNKPREVAADDAERVADAIASSIRGGPPFGVSGSRAASPSDFLVLSRRRANLPAYARALEARGVAYEIAGGGAFRDSEEIATLLAALEAIADPENPVPLVATLRGPLFGVDDETLYRFAKAGGRFDFRSRPPARSDPRIRRAYEILSEGSDLAATLPPAAALSRLVERLGAIALAAAGSLGDARAGNLVKALATARELSRQREPFPEIVRRLAELAEQDKVEEMVTRPTRSDVVRLMTLHRAKGLEARVVFLADPTAPNPPGPRLWIDRSADPSRAYVLVERKTGPHSREEIARPPGWDEKCALEKEFQDREDERLLYVAATRARDALVVSFRRNSKGEVGGPWRRLDAWARETLPEGAAPAAAATPGSAPDAFENELEAFRARRAGRLAASSKPTTSATSVTAFVHAASDPEMRPFVPGTGRGMSWGSALHRLLEAAMRDPGVDLRALGKNVLAEEDRPAEDLESALATVEGVRRSALWSRALASKRCLVEVPFALFVPSSDLGGLPGAPAETILSGAIDLVFEEPEGWILVDYKSDTIAGNLDALVEFYTPQIDHYRRVWRDLTGRPTRAGLFFLEKAHEVWLKD